MFGKAAQSALSASNTRPFPDPMHPSTFRLVLLVGALCTCGPAGCASHGKPKQPTSSWRMIDEGDANPFITDNPERAGTIVKQQEQR